MLSAGLARIQDSESGEEILDPGPLFLGGEGRIMRSGGVEEAPSRSTEDLFGERCCDPNTQTRDGWEIKGGNDDLDELG